MSRKRERLRRALGTIVTANLGEMCVFWQAVRQIEPQVFRGTAVEFALEAGPRALGRQSECVLRGSHRCWARPLTVSR